MGWASKSLDVAGTMESGVLLVDGRMLKHMKEGTIRWLIGTE